MSCRILSLGLTLAVMISGCSTEQGYNSVKDWQKNECNHRVDNRDREQCLKDADTSYDDYKKQTATPQKVNH
jgi:PBP1b-binding outer membrane lipoprotein LpoB